MLTLDVMKKVSDVVMFSPPRSYTVQRVDRARSVQHIGGPFHEIGSEYHFPVDSDSQE
jgi:hypothetical protein